MGSLFADPSIGDHQNLICLTDGIQAVCNHKQCFTLYQFIDCLLDITFIIGINTCSRFIQNDNRRVFQNTAGNRNSLLFAAGQGCATFTDDCLESIRQRHDKIIAAGFFCSLIDFFLGSVRFTHADIVVNGILEQVHPLENHADLFHQFGERYIPNICTTDCHFAGFHIPQPRQKVRNRGFATARRSHKCGHGILLHREADVVQDFLVLIGEGHIAKLYFWLIRLCL